jgi:methylmalonyl-CoA mutase N-terminal domain/subunit
MEKRIWDLVKEIESKGDFASLYEAGFFKHFFEQTMNRYQEDLVTGRRKLVGVNIFATDREHDTFLKDVIETKIPVAEEQILKIKRLKAERNHDRAMAALNNVYQAARSETANLIPVIKDALKEDATMGEITGAVRLAYGANYDPHGMVQAPF